MSVPVLNGLKITPQPGDPVSPADGAIWFNSVTGTLRMAQQGQVVDVTSLGPLYARFLVMN
jgi:hypothetical protein